MVVFPECLSARILGTNETNKIKKNSFFEKRTGEVAENKEKWPKTNRNEPENEAEKLLKIRTCGKNEAENEAGHVAENTRQQKDEPKTNRSFPAG